MRPIKLTMSGFGPFGEQVEIDFSKFTGLYIITGDTGAGKTTIFDAITFALYGDVSGNVREPSMLRSDFADKDTPTFVKLEFSYRGAIYEIERSPSYRKPGNKHPTPPSAFMTMPDGKVKNGMKEVTKEVTELLGIDKNQFTQIAMIAQGDFMKLLIADTDERGKIFRKLFGTGIYMDFQNAMKERLSSAKEKMDLTELQLMQEAASVSGTEPPSDIGAMDDFLEKLSVMLSDDAKQETELQKQEEQLQKLSSDLANGLTLLKSRYAALEGSATNQAVDSAIKKTIEEHIEDESIQRQLTEKRARMQADLTERVKLKNAQTENQSYLEKLDEKKAALETLQKDRDVLCEQIEKTEKQASDLSGIELDREKIKGILKDYATEQKEIDLLFAKVKRWKESNSALERAQAEYLAAENEFQIAEEKAVHTENLFLREQAGIMAQRLQEGVPCPVCGAKEHPKPAELAETAPSEEEVKRYKADAKEKERIKNARSENAAALIREKENILTEIREQAVHFRLSGKEEITEIEAVAKGTQKQLAERVQTAQTELAQLDHAEQERNELEKNIDELKQRREKLSQQYESMEKTIQNLREDLRAGESRVEEIKSHLNYDLESGAEEKVHEIEDQLAVIKACMAELIEEYAAHIRENQAAMSEIAEQRRELYGKLANNRKISEYIQNKLPDFKRCRTDFANIESLSKTASGELRGQSKLAFEQYIQSAYFERIILRANERFIKMSGGRYEFTPGFETAGKKFKTGLDLDVIDNYTGKNRSVKSLSGGEGFKASLSLALGMSDVIQASAGGIQLDSMFVDEGFGALDDESLEQAIGILSELTGGSRSVGIISHVQELKERIDKRIMVKKSLKGSSVCIDI